MSEVLESIETLSTRIGLNVTMGDLHISQLNAGEQHITALGVANGTPLTQVARVIIADNRPVAYLVDILPEDILSMAELSNGFTGSVLDLLLRRGTPALVESRTEIRAVAASTEVARALEIQRGDVLLFFEAYLYCTGGRAIDFSHSYFLPGYFRFHVVRRVGPVWQSGR